MNPRAAAPWAAAFLIGLYLIFDQMLRLRLGDCYRGLYFGLAGFLPNAVLREECRGRTLEFLLDYFL